MEAQERRRGRPIDHIQLVVRYLAASRKFYEAVRKTNSQVEWVEYAAEGHGWALPVNRFDYWRRVEAFLQRHIGTPGTSTN